MYRLGQRGERPHRHRRKRWFAVFIIFLLLICAGVWGLQRLLHPKTVITQARATTTHVTYNDAAIKHYDEPDFSINLPSTWQALPRPAGQYQTYDWQLIAKATSESITIYEDTIPANFAVNRVVILEPQTDHVSLKGSASDNCSNYTTNTPSNTYQGGAPAKWQEVNFLCDQSNTERDVLGTSSVDGINTVSLHSQSNGHSHKFFFTYTDHVLNPDYSVFYNAMNSFHLN